VSAITLLTGIHLDTRTRKSCHLPEDVATADKARVLVVAYEPALEPHEYDKR
jgi:hypothetical protein